MQDALSTYFIKKHKCNKTQLQEAGWSPYPTFEELHQILYRAELNIYENFNMPPGITVGDDGSHVNDKTIEMVKKLIDRPPKFIVEASIISDLFKLLSCTGICERWMQLDWRRGASSWLAQHVVKRPAMQISIWSMQTFSRATSLDILEGIYPAYRC